MGSKVLGRPGLPALGSFLSLLQCKLVPGPSFLWDTLTHQYSIIVIPFFHSFKVTVTCYGLRSILEREHRCSSSLHRTFLQLEEGDNAPDQ